MTSIQSKEAAAVVRQVVLLNLAFASGVVLFAGVSTGLVLTGNAPDPMGLDEMGVWLVVGIAAAFAFSAGAVGRAVGPSAPQASTREVAQKTLVSGIVKGALHESTGLIGGFLILLTGEIVIGCALALLSVGFLLMGRPDREELERRLLRANLGSGES